LVVRSLVASANAISCLKTSLQTSLLHAEWTLNSALSSLFAVLRTAGSLDSLVDAMTRLQQKLRKKRGVCKVFRPLILCSTLIILLHPPSILNIVQVLYYYYYYLFIVHKYTSFNFCLITNDVEHDIYRH